MDMSLSRLRLLVEFAHRGTISDVAVALHYTPSAVSQQLSALQRDTNVHLLDHVGRHLQLTEAGRILVEHAEEILTAEQRAQIALEKLQHEVSGHLSVGVLATVAATLLPPITEILHQRHPNISVTTREIEPENGLRAVLRGDLDLAFILDYPDAPLTWDPTLNRTHIGTEEHYLIAPTALFPPHQTQIALTDLANLDWIASGVSTDFGRALQAACRRAGFNPHIVHQVDEQSTAMAMAAAGLGITLAAGLAHPLYPQNVHTIPVTPSFLRHVLIATRATTHGRPIEKAFVHAAIQASETLHLDYHVESRP